MRHFQRASRPRWPPLLLLLFVLSTNASLAYVPSNKPAADDRLEAELTLLDSPPRGPTPTLPSDRLARFCLQSLQLVDHPNTLDGLDRIFPFLTWECRGATTSSGGVDNTSEKFRRRAALSPVLQPLMGATKIDLGEGTLSGGTATRGDITSYPVAIYGAEVLAFQHKSGMIRDRISSGPPRHDFVMRLEKMRRPPLADCWMVREICDVRFAKGGQGWSRHEGV